MCGRHSRAQPDTAAERFGFVDWHERRIQPRLNIAPGRLVLTVVAGPGGPEAPLMYWGFQPGYLKHPRAGAINARAETLLDKPLFKACGRSQAVSAPGRRLLGGAQSPGAKRGVPTHIRLKSGEPFALAGLWMPSKDGELTCAIVTTQANELLAPIHDRMPAILRPQDEALWLDGSMTNPLAVMSCLRPHDSSLMEAFSVSSRVSSVTNDGPQLLEPSAASAARGCPEGSPGAPATRH
jgi:putative SOS response-associated peptidase YedK